MMSSQESENLNPGDAIYSGFENDENIYKMQENIRNFWEKAKGNWEYLE